MTGIAMMQAGMKAPVLAFLPDDDVFPFDALGLLFGKARWLAQQDRHVGIEIVDSDERRWAVTGLCPGEAPKKRWWQLGAPAEPVDDIELQPLDSQRFDVTRRRVEAQASALFNEGDEALAQIRSSSTMAELSAACFQITMRAQGRRILAGDPAVRVRRADEVARRALTLFAMVRLSHDVDRSDIMNWLASHGLTQALSPDEAELLAARRLTEEQRGEAGWTIEGLVALLWALGFIEMPRSDAFADISAIIEIVPPSGDISVDAFLAAARLRPLPEIAAMSEDYHEALCRARIGYAENPSGADAGLADVAHRRAGALQWIMNPERLLWP